MGDFIISRFNHILLKTIFPDPVYTDAGDNMNFGEAHQNNPDMTDPQYIVFEAESPGSGVNVHHTSDMLEPVYQDATETLTGDVQMRETVSRYQDGNANVYSFAKDSGALSQIIDRRHGVHGEHLSVLPGDIDGLFVDVNQEAGNLNVDEIPNAYITLKDVTENDDSSTFVSYLKSPGSDTVSGAETANAAINNVNNSETPVNFDHEGEYEFVDYARVKKSRKGQPRHEALVQKKGSPSGQKAGAQSQKALVISEMERKTARQKSKALKRGKLGIYSTNLFT